MTCYYSLYYSGETWRTFIQLTAEKTSYVAQHLIEGMEYLFTLRSRTASGWGNARMANITVGPQKG